MKNLFILLVLAAAGYGIYNYVANQAPTKPAGPSVRIGATVAEVEQVLGAPLSVLPNFGRELRAYKAKSGNRYMLTFENGELIEIQQ